MNPKTLAEAEADELRVLAYEHEHIRTLAHSIYMIATGKECDGKAPDDLAAGFLDALAIRLQNLEYLAYSKEWANDGGTDIEDVNISEELSRMAVQADAVSDLADRIRKARELAKQPAEPEAPKQLADRVTRTGSLKRRSKGGRRHASR